MQPPAANLSYIPYGKQTIEEDDIQAVVNVLRSDWITTGPTVQTFEQTFADFVSTKEAVAVSNGTAALHAAVHSIGIQPGDEVIVPVITFVASANCILFEGGTPVLCDVDPETLLLDIQEVERKITSQTKAILTVDFAGQMCDYDVLRSLANNYQLKIIADSCHALGASYKKHPAGSLADISTFSFHPVKHITTGEGGMAVTGEEVFATSMRRFRSHGVNADFKQRSESNTWYYEMQDLGYNYRLTDIQCGLGISQLRKFPQWLSIRRNIAKLYDQAFHSIKGITSLTTLPDNEHAYHLYVIKVMEEECGISREKLFHHLRKNNIGVNVHYIPLHHHPYYKQNVPSASSSFPTADQAYQQILSLPIHQNMKADDAVRVIDTIKSALPV